MWHASLGEVRLTVLRCSVLTSVLMALNFKGGFCAEFQLPTSQTVEAYDLAFFACEVPGKSQPLWLINQTEYLSINLIPDHVTNISGLIVHARPEYNNTEYECRFVDISFDEVGFIDKDVLTSPTAVLTIIDKIADEPPCSCDRNPPTRVTYNYTSQLLRISLNESLSETSIIGMSLCYSGTVGKYLNQTCSAFDVDLSSESYNHLLLIAFPPVCNACNPVLDYTIYLGMDFNLNATIPSSQLQELQVSGTCLMSSLYTVVEFQCSNFQICITANEESKFVIITNEQLFSLNFEQGTLEICFPSSAAFHDIFGEVKEVYVQEVCVTNSTEVCGDPQSVVGAPYVHIFGSRGRLPLPFNQTDVEPETVCSLMDASSSLMSFSPSKTLASSPQYITSSMSETSTSTSLPLTTRLVLPSYPTKIMPSGMDLTSANVSPSTATSDGPGTAALAFIIVGCIVGILLIVIFGSIIVTCIIYIVKRSSGGSYKCGEVHESEGSDDEDVKL